MKLYIPLAITLAACTVAPTLQAQTKPDASQMTAKKSVQRGIDYLKRTQEADGSWGHYPATTALALSNGF